MSAIEQSPPKAILFDFGDTLFGRDGGYQRVIRAAARLGADVSDLRARQVWESIQARARTPEEIARGRDLSLEAHRRCWTELYRQADVLADGMAELLYNAEVDPNNWVPFVDTRPCLECLFEASIPVGVVSDTGWDIRAVFEHHGLDRMIETYVLSFEQGVAKPAVTLFEQACRDLGVLPADAVMIGDNPLTDGGSVGAGISCLILPSQAEGGRRGLDAVLRLAGLAPPCAPARSERCR